MKNHVASPAVCGMYSDLAAYYATFLCKSSDRKEPAIHKHILRLREQAFEVLKKNLQPDDPRVLHRGLELAEELVQQVYFAKAATLLKEIQPNAKSLTLTYVDLLVAKSGVCIGLLGFIELSRLEEEPPVFSFCSESQKEIRESCAGLGIKVLFSDEDWGRAEQVNTLIRQLRKQAETILREAEKSIEDSPEDTLIQDRVIEVLQRRATLAAFCGEEQRCTQYAQLANQLREERKRRS
jgi:hypothetical protein